MAKYEQVLKRDDGSEAKIVAQACFGLGLTCSIDVYVHRRDNPDQPWRLTSDSPHPDWRQMSVDDYIKHGRSEMLQTVSIGEILKATQAVRTSLAM